MKKKGSGNYRRRDVGADVAARAALPGAAPPARRADRGVLLPAGRRGGRPRRGGARRLARLVREIAFSSGERPVARPFGATDPGRRAQFSETASEPLAFVPVHPQPQHGGGGRGPPPVRDLTAYQAEGGGGGATCVQSSMGNGLGGSPLPTQEPWRGLPLVARRPTT